MIEFKNVSFEYQPNSPFASKALFDIDLKIKDHSFTALIGHTGSGKSTLIQHLNGLLKPTQGIVYISDLEIKPESKQKDIKLARRTVGVVFQFPEAQLFEETVLKDVAFGPQNFGVSQEEAEITAREMLRRVGIDEEHFDKSPFELSGGQMRRVAIAGILAMQPKVLVLDEPTAGLDPKSRLEMMKMFYELHETRGLTVVLVTHNMDDVADYADEVFLLEKGRIIQSGLPSDVFQSPEFLTNHQLGIPRATQFALALKKRGLEFEKLPITRQELVEMLGMFRDQSKEEKRG
ncbi:MAG: energy-coupling factor ABC transporter ATP-binding protein [Streptococcaceae bacterium]|jgi:energy-coupling factor transport system ATP-binding protein|nr:energy-coupling factor ABC transporter ATP-binding protein [Streptococcaceae bacterium]